MARGKLKVVDAPEHEYHWRKGFIPPKGVAASDVRASLGNLPEITPENLYEASKSKRHVLHTALWSEGDQEWARAARIEYCRRVISNIVEVVPVGGKSIEVRAIEFIRPEGQSRWASIEDIMADPVMRDAHLSAIQDLQEEAAAKLQRFRDLASRK